MFIASLIFSVFQVSVVCAFCFIPLGRLTQQHNVERHCLSWQRPIWRPVPVQAAPLQMWIPANVPEQAVGNHPSAQSCVYSGKPRRRISRCTPDCSKHFAIETEYGGCLSFCLSLSLSVSMPFKQLLKVLIKVFLSVLLQIGHLFFCPHCVYVHYLSKNLFKPKHPD